MKQVKLTDVCDIQYGYPFDSSNFSSSPNDGMPLIRIRDVKEGKSETYYKGSYPKDYIVHKGDYLIGMDGEFNIGAWQSGDALLNQRVCKVESKSSNVSTHYLYRFFKKELKRIEDETPFVTVKHLSAKRLNQVYLDIPSLEEQERIVSELDLLTGIIDKQKQQLKELDSLAQSIFYDMFGNPVDNEKGFPLLTMDDVVSFQGGSQPDKSHFEFEPTKDNIRLLQIRDYRTDKYPTYIPISLARRFCTKDDIMIGRYGPPIFQIFKGLEGSYNVALMKAVPKKGNREFIRAFLKQKCLLHFLESHSKRTAGQDGIQMDKLKAYPFPFPPMELQNQFEERMRIIEQQQEILNRSIAESQKLFDYTMDKYFG